jgi:hypothetical protein
MASPQITPLLARKEELNRETERYKQAIEDQMSVLKQDAGKVTRTALIIGGAALGTYLVGRAIVNRKKKKRAQNELKYPYPYPTGLHTTSLHSISVPAISQQSKRSNPNPVVSLITKQLAVFLVAMAKQSIMAAIERGKHEPRQNSAPIIVK